MQTGGDCLCSGLVGSIGRSSPASVWSAAPLALAVAAFTGNATAADLAGAAIGALAGLERGASRCVSRRPLVTSRRLASVDLLAGGVAKMDASGGRGETLIADDDFCGLAGRAGRLPLPYATSFCARQRWGCM